MNLRRLTHVVILVAVGGLIGYDLLPYATDAEGDTISEVVHGWGLVYGLIPWGFGVLLGHFFSASKRTWSTPQALLGIGASAVVLGLVDWVAPGIPSLIWVVGGLFAGHALWPVQEGEEEDETDR